ncbi:MAG: succinate dehydrogenase cytochrome b subunit [Thermoanaerobaculia bacterium]|jgi:succinate dehydrogenase / fumarate reductase cytochrome b subunit|nr:MAG: succinate dehydrogenase cytochrome b subunit [Thermoanaerobaculia bacterium]MBZ0100530.1 succinate dehydrogenase cytochrome b subunit [Thermoanaerobaculia bacterium]
MNGFASLLTRAVGRKALMAISGIVLFGFVLVHMVGNLKLYQGRYADGVHAGQWKIDVYGEGLRELGAPVLGHGQALWIARLVLLACVLLHIASAWAVTRQSRAARPVAYQVRVHVQSSYAVRTMRWGGVIIALFVAWHLADLTLGWVHPSFVAGGVHANLVASFQRPAVAGLYIVANLALGLHLFHGLWSLFQTLGWNNPKFNHWRRSFATAFAGLVTAGNLSFPLAVLMGWVK